jgi:hypothetical protein
VRVGLHNIVEILVGSVADILSLPKAEGVDEPNLVISSMDLPYLRVCLQDIDIALNDSISSSVGVFVP